VPLLLLANKQDSPASLSVDEIRRDYEEWYQNKVEASRRSYAEESGVEFRRERIASLDVMGVSALEGTGVREAIDWLFIRVQNSRSLDDGDKS